MFFVDTAGNDPELDPDRAPEPPTKAIDKPIQRTGKRNAGPEPPLRAGAAAAAPRGGREGAPGMHETLPFISKRR